VSAQSLTEGVGVPRPTPSPWLRETSSHSYGAMAKTDQGNAPPRVEEPAARRPQDSTAAERLRAVAKTLALEGEQLGEHLRRNGIHHGEQLEQWRTEALAGLEQLRRQRLPAEETKRIKELERELRKMEKALAEAAALLVLRKQVPALWATTRTGAKSRDRRRGEGSGVGRSPHESVCKEVGIDPRTMQRWTAVDNSDDQRPGPNQLPANALTKVEEDDIVSVLKAKEFCDLYPHQVLAKLADVTIYKTSERTMNRLLRDRKLLGPRERGRVSRTV